MMSRNYKVTVDGLEEFDFWLQARGIPRRLLRLFRLAYTLVMSTSVFAAGLFCGGFLFPIYGKLRAAPAVLLYAGVLIHSLTILVLCWVFGRRILGSTYHAVIRLDHIAIILGLLVALWYIWYMCIVHGLPYE